MTDGDNLDLPKPFRPKGFVFSVYYEPNIMPGVERWIVDNGILSENELKAPRVVLSKYDLDLIRDNGEHADIISLVRGLSSKQLDLFEEEGLVSRGLGLSEEGEARLLDLYGRWKRDENYLGSFRNGRLKSEARAYFVLANKDDLEIFGALDGEDVAA